MLAPTTKPQQMARELSTASDRDADPSLTDVRGTHGSTLHTYGNPNIHF
jgi:hypothetical protein